jgi:transcriptional regulator with XRE-family HTH domain
MSLGEKIRSLRTKRNMSQNDLADVLQVSRQSISKWETDGAIPDLDKLVKMSETFGITLDELIKGAAPAPSIQASGDEAAGAAPDTKEAPVRAPHRIAGTILLCFGALIALLLFILGGGLASIIYASPFLICGVICLYTHQRTGLWCGWAIYLCVDLYLRYAAGISWGVIRLTAQFTQEMNYMQLAIGWVQFLVGVLLILLTIWSYRKKTVNLG